MLDEQFHFDYVSPTILGGCGCIQELGGAVKECGASSALIVTGTTVGQTSAVMDPVREGLGERVAGEFRETTPEKRLATAIKGTERALDIGADSLVAVGGGSSIDTARAIAVLLSRARKGHDPPSQVWEQAGAELASTGTLSIPSSPSVPIAAVPTTLAGADLSQVAGLTATPSEGYVDSEVSGGLSGRSLMPSIAVWDPALVATTPDKVLAGSAMNGFDKGIETLYTADRTPITDASALRGLELLQRGLLAFGAGERSQTVYERMSRGCLLVQYGISRPDAGTLSLIHAFGHGLTGFGTVQQGAAHAVIAPHALRYLFENVDGRRALLAQAIAEDSTTDPAAAVVEAVEDLRDALDLPRRLRDVDGPTQNEFRAVATAVIEDSFMAHTPPGLDPTVEDIQTVLERAW